MCVAVLLWEGARNVQLHGINLGLNFDVSSQTKQNSQPTHKNVNTIKKQIPQTRRESHPRNLWSNALESPFCGKQSDGSTCAWGPRAFWWTQWPKHFLGFILPDSRTFFVAFTVFCYVCCKSVLPVHCTLCSVGSRWNPSVWNLQMAANRLLRNKTQKSWMC